MEARYYDGRSARSQVVTVSYGDRALQFHADGAAHCWPAAELRLERLGDQLRAAPGEASAERLIFSRAEWEAITGSDAGLHRVRRSRELRLVAGLTAVAVTAASVVFIGIPAASGPLARRTPPSLERQIGDNLDAQLSLALPTCASSAGQTALARLGRRLGSAAGTPFEIRVRAVRAPIVNAFALPGGAILVTDGLIDMARTPDELSAVIAHEAAHVQHRDVMQGVWRSFGFGVVLDALVGGGTGAGQQAVLLMGSFTNLRFTRQAEADADVGGQRLLQSQGLSSQGMAPFFERLAAKGEGRNAKLVKELMSDHPDTAHRAEVSRARAVPGAAAFTAQEWTAIKAVCASTPGRLSRLRRLF